MKEKLFDKKNVLTEKGRIVSDDISRSVKRLVLKYKDCNLRELGYLLHSSIGFPIALECVIQRSKKK